MKNNKPLPKRKSIHLKHLDYSSSDHVFFITIATAEKKPYFLQPDVAGIIVDEIDFRANASKGIKLYCYCVMPDHIHILLKLSEGYKKSLQNWVAAFKRYTARIVNGFHSITPLWQKNFYDHVVRKEESLIKIAEYIVNNPVRKGMAQEWSKYPFSYMADPFPI